MKELTQDEALQMIHKYSRFGSSELENQEEMVLLFLNTNYQEDMVEGLITVLKKNILLLELRHMVNKSK